MLGMLLAACAGDESQRASTAVVVPSATPDAAQSDVNPATDGDGGPAGSSTATCTITPQWLRPYKACTVDADCETVAYRQTCCPAQQIVGVSHTDADQVQACADQAAAPCNNSSCAGRPDRAEDGRAVQTDFSDVTVHCVDNACQTAVAERACGKSLTCEAGEVCVIYQNVPGSAPPLPDSGENALFSYACAKNSCGDKHLDCSCAQALCDSRADVPRRCAVDFTQASQSDVFCSADHQ
jgi:hypothetical protein